MTKTLFLPKKSKTALTPHSEKMRVQLVKPGRRYPFCCYYIKSKNNWTSQEPENEEREKEKMHPFHKLENIKSADRILCILRANQHTKEKSHGPSTTTCHLQLTLLFRYLPFPFFFSTLTRKYEYVKY